MAKKKETFTFLEPAKDKRYTRSVAARIDGATLDKFDKAVKLIEAKGLTLSITSVIQKAIDQAISEVEQALDIDIDQLELPIEIR